MKLRDYLLEDNLNELFEKLPEIEIDWWATMDAATVSLPKGTNINTEQTSP